jgi:hypothetical protein
MYIFAIAHYRTKQYSIITVGNDSRIKPVTLPAASARESANYGEDGRTFLVSVHIFEVTPHIFDYYLLTTSRGRGSDQELVRS